nr:hypothetical protein [Tanacetum cinerariifolium]
MNLSSLYQDPFALDLPTLHCEACTDWGVLHYPNVDEGEYVTPPDGAWTEYVSEGVTLFRISSTKHKERPLRDDSQKALKKKGNVDTGCSRHMTGNKADLVDYQD